MGFGKDHRGVILRNTIAQALGTLAQNIAVSAGSIGINEDFRLLKTLAVAGLTGLTAGQGNTLMLGIANGELSIAEISECLAANGPTGPSDRNRIERAERQVHIVGVLERNDPADTVGSFRDVNSGAPMITDKFPWTYTDQDSWQWFVFNPSAAGVTTGASLHLVATHYGVWVI